MRTQPIYRIVTNGKCYAIQRKDGVMAEWEFCTHFVATSDFSGGYVPLEYPFKWMARWKMNRLMQDEEGERDVGNEQWEEVAL